VLPSLYPFFWSLLIPTQGAVILFRICRQFPEFLFAEIFVSYISIGENAIRIIPVFIDLLRYRSYPVFILSRGR